MLAPKFYGGINQSGYQVLKTKGFKGSIDVKLLETLREKDSIIYLSQDKWYKSVVEGSLTLKSQTFGMRATMFKRKPIYDANNKLIATEPFRISEDKVIINK